MTGHGLGSRWQLLHSLAETITTVRPAGQPVLVGVTGIDAAGKTRLTDELAAELRHRGAHVEVIHVDDFHHPRQLRYAPGVPDPDRYLQHSIDIDQLVTRLLRPIRRDGALTTSLTHLDLATDTRSVHRTYTVTPATVVLVEGVFLLRADVRHLLDLLVFLHVPEDVALARGTVRDAAAGIEDPSSRYLGKYLPAQRRFLREHPPAALADVLVDHTDPQRPRVLPRLPRRPKAVVCDLWQTLVPLPATVKRDTFAATAAALGGPPAELRDRWALTRRRRETGPLDLYLRWLREDLAARWPEPALQRAIAVRARGHGRCFTAPAVAAAAAVLARLRAAGLPVAVVSNCSSDVRAMLTSSPLAAVLDAVVLSAETGLMKPDPAIYARAAAALDVDPVDCLYVGDGGDDELHGAAAAGMTPVLLDPDPDTEPDAEPAIPFAGPRIRSLSGLLPLLAVEVPALAETPLPTELPLLTETPVLPHGPAEPTRTP